MRAGFGKADITPETGLRLAGFDARTQPSNGVLDRLEVRTLVLEEGQRMFCWLTFDLLGVNRPLCEYISRSIEDDLHFPQDSIFLSATHTHAAPKLVPGQVDGYVMKLARAAKASVREAAEKLNDVKLRAGEERVEGIASYRDKNREASAYAMPLRLMHCFAASGVDIGLELISCHPTVLDETNLLVSADLPGRARGEHSLMLNGACADLSTRYTRQGKGEKELERIGWKLGEAIKSSACADISEGFATIKRRIVLPQRMDFSDEERKTLKYGFSERLSRMSDPAAKREIESCLLVLNRPPKETSPFRTVEIGLNKIGDVLMLTLPFEMSSVDGEAMEGLLRAVSGLRAWTVCYTGGYDGYLPSGRPLGIESGYQDIASPYPPEAVDIIKQNAIEMAKELINGYRVS
ncbi:MAG: neutral/alkaline non-lysosomal ceramidase N-terminal domain-containing protein [Clostridiales bacterium]|nr:neutral/alkaline non-lysosomal ceramidase N-terminal domain-containing protein [Clostridiales bacterium]